MSATHKIDDRQPPPPLEELPEANQRLLRYFEQWAKEPPDEDEKFWREFEADLQKNRLSFR